MQHSEYIRIVPDGHTAVLFIHGILGTPHHFDMLLNSIPANYSIYNLLLEGHGGNTENFSAASMQRWKAQVNLAISKLSNNHSRIIIVGHSMGALLAIEAAVRRPANISDMLLLAVPMKILLTLPAITNSAKVIFGCVKPCDRMACAARDAYSITPDKRLWKYIPWLPRYIELFILAEQSRSHIRRLSPRCTVLHSLNDELVSAKSCMYLLRNPNIDIKILPRSGHYYYHPKDKKQIIREFEKML